MASSRDRAVNPGECGIPCEHLLRLVKKRKMMHDSIDDGSTAATPASSSSISEVP